MTQKYVLKAYKVLINLEKMPHLDYVKSCTIGFLFCINSCSTWVCIDCAFLVTNDPPTNVYIKIVSRFVVSVSWKVSSVTHFYM
jgi:hypothetical protein